MPHSRCPRGSEHGCPLPNTQALCVTCPSPSRIPVVRPSTALPGDDPGAQVTSEGGAPTPRVPLLPSPPPSHPLLFLNRRAGCSVQPRTNRPSPRSRSGGSPDLFFQPTPLWHLQDLGAVWPGAFPLHRASRALECS